MTKIVFIESDGNRVEATAQTGQSLMQTAVNAGIAAIAAECGGVCACGTCHCHIDPGWFGRLSPAADDEADMLEFVIDPDEHSRLSCQIKVTEELDGLIVHVPESQT